MKFHQREQVQGIMLFGSIILDFEKKKTTAFFDAMIYLTNICLLNQLRKKIFVWRSENVRYFSILNVWLTEKF